LRGEVADERKEIFGRSRGNGKKNGGMEMNGVGDNGERSCEDVRARRAGWRSSECKIARECEYLNKLRRHYDIHFEKSLKMNLRQGR
jgi:hypothetical protein